MKHSSREEKTNDEVPEESDDQRLLTLNTTLSVMISKVLISSSIIYCVTNVDVTFGLEIAFWSSFKSFVRVFSFGFRCFKGL